MTLQQPTAAPKPTALPLNIVSSHDEEGHGLPVIGLIGDNFAGKTTQALSFPKPFVLNFGNNSTILAQSEAVPYLQLSKSSEMLAAANYVKAHKLSSLLQQVPGFEDYGVKTVIVDSTTDMSLMLDLEVGGGTEGKLERDAWARKLAIENKFISAVIEGTRFRPGQEQYYLVIISHFKPVMGGPKGELTEYRHHISGSFYQTLKGVYDICLEVRADQQCSPDGSGNAVRQARPKHSAWTVPSHALKTFIGDRLGGRGGAKGRFGRLPTVLDIPEGVGLFSLLEKHWHGAK